MKKIWIWLNGKKTVLGACAMLIINSDYVASYITDPNLYILLQGLAGILFGAGMLHKAGKSFKK